MSTPALENKKSAVLIWVTLSTQVMAATLALIAVEGAFVTYILDKRVPYWSFYVSAIVTLFLFIFSILSGGVGIDALSGEGYKGNWDLNFGRPYFQRQTISCLIGVALFFIALFVSGPTKEDTTQKEFRALQDKVQLQQTLMDSSKTETQRLRDDLNSALKELETIKNKIAPPASDQRPGKQKRR